MHGLKFCRVNEVNDHDDDGGGDDVDTFMTADNEDEDDDGDKKFIRTLQHRTSISQCDCRK